MLITIRDVCCPLCGSDKTRSKVGDKDQTWWYICDNWDDPHLINLNDEEDLDLRDMALKAKTRMFYFNVDKDPDTIIIELIDGRRVCFAS
jgi:hypothetical protein